MDKYKDIHIQYEINLLLSSSFDVNETSKELLKIICQLDEIDSGGIYIVNDDNSLSLVSHHGLTNKFIDSVKFYPSDSQNSLVVQNGEPINKNNIKEHIDNIKSNFIVPILYKKIPLACLNLASHKYDEISYNTQEIIKSISLNLGGFIMKIKSEKKLIESQENFSSLFNTIEDFLFILDSSGKIIDTNEYTIKKLGFKKEEIIGIDVYNLHPLDKKQEVEIAIDRIMKGEQNTCLIPLINNKGDLIPVETKIVKGKWDQEPALFGISRDMSKHKHYEETINDALEQQILLADISQLLNNSYYHIQNEDNINKALKLIGEFINVSRVYIFEDDNLNKCTHNTHEWCNTGISKEIDNLQNITYDSLISRNELYFKNKGIFISNEINKLQEDLQNFLLPQGIKSILIFPLIDNNKEPFGFIGFDECHYNRFWTKDEIEFLRTISNIMSNTFNRMKIEKQLKNSKDFTENLMKTATVMIVGLDLKGNVTMFNKSSEKITGYKSSEIIGKNWFNDLSILSKTDARTLNDIFQNIIINDESFDTYENSIITKEGEIKYILWQNNEIIENEKVTGIISFGLDISDRKKYEETLMESKNKAEKSNQTKLEFLTNMSHDLRTPMNSIIGFSDLLKSNNLTKSEKNDYINIIINNGKFLMALIDDIIDISKIDAGSLKIENNEFEINKLLNDMKLSYAKQTKDKKIQMILDIDVNKNIIINSDKYRLRQILMNLISNAIKFTNNGYIKFGYTILNNNELELYVEDTGPGIERQHQKIIFERFKQLNPSNKFKGAGLGLSITQSLIELLGFGNIKLISELQKGSKFYFTAPYTIKHYNYINETIDKKKHKKVNFADKTILIIEDNQDSRFIMRTFLAQTGANIIELNDGVNALKTFKNNKIDIVIIDVNLPNGISGFDILTEIRKIDENVPIIIETALAMSDKRSKAFSLGCDDYITKPFNKENFLDRINNLI